MSDTQQGSSERVPTEYNAAEKFSPRRVNARSSQTSAPRRDLGSLLWSLLALATTTLVGAVSDASDILSTGVDAGVSAVRGSISALQGRRAQRDSTVQSTSRNTGRVPIAGVLILCAALGLVIIGCVVLSPQSSTPDGFGSLDSNESSGGDTFSGGPQSLQPQQINYTVTDVNAYKKYVDVRVTYTFNTTLNHSTLTARSGSSSLTGEFLSGPANASINPTNLTLNRSHNRLTFEYRIFQSSEQSRTHYAVKYTTTFLSWPNISGTHSTDQDQYTLSTDSVPSSYTVQSKLETTDKFATNPTPLYQNASIETDGEFLLISNNRPEFTDSSITTSTHRFDNTTYRLIDGTSRSPNPTSVLSQATALFNSSTTTRVISPTVFVVPDAVTNGLRGGAFHGGSDPTIWLTIDGVDTTQSTVLGHELVHASQTYSVDSELQWWIEASAAYLGGLIETRAHDSVNHDAFAEQMFHPTDWEYCSIPPTNRTAQLSTPDTWTHYFQYFQGARLASIIDETLRTHTDGTHTLLSLHQWMQSHESVTYSEFRAQIAAWTSPAFASQLDQYGNQSDPIQVDYHGHVPNSC